MAYRNNNLKDIQWLNRCDTKSSNVQHCTCKTKDDNALDDTINDVLDGALDAFNPGGRVQPWRTRSNLEDAFNPYDFCLTVLECCYYSGKREEPSKGKSYQVVGEHNNFN